MEKNRISREPDGSRFAMEQKNKESIELSPTGYGYISVTQNPRQRNQQRY